MSNTSYLGTSSARSDPGFVAEMAAFDRLPPALREALREAPIVVGAVAALQALPRFGERRMIEMMRASLCAQLPAIVAQTWGRDHPQAR